MSDQKDLHKIGNMPMEKLVQYSGMELLQKIKAGELPAPPFIHTLGIEFTKLLEGEILLTYMPTTDYYNIISCLHGGIVSVLLDTAMACAIQTKLDKGQAYTTLELKTNFVRPVYESTGLVHAEGRLIHVGRTTATAEGKLFDDRGKLYAFATTTCILIK